MKQCYGRYNPRLLFKMLCYTNRERDTYESLKEQKNVFEGKQEPKTTTQIHLWKATKVFHYLNQRRTKLTRFHLKKAYQIFQEEDRPLEEEKLSKVLRIIQQKEPLDLFSVMEELFTMIIIDRIFHQYSREFAILLTNIYLLKERYSPLLFYTGPTTKIIKEIRTNRTKALKHYMMVLWKISEAYNTTFRVKDTERLIQKVLNKEEALKTTYEIERLYFFGSYATHQQTKYSDLDVYVKPKEMNYQKGKGLKEFLESLLKIRVDLFIESPNRRMNGLSEDFGKEKLQII